MSTRQPLPDSRHFELRQLAEGVFAAIHRDGGAAIGNAGIVDLGDRTLVFDTFLAPRPAEDLRAAAEVLTGRPVDAAIDSHWHSDHIWGNQVFGADTDIISTEATRRLIVATKGDEDFDSLMANAEAKLRATLAKLHAETEEGRRRELALWVDEYRGIVEAKPMLQVRAPNLTFSRRLAFYGTKRSAELMDLAGHTESDAALFLPQDGIVFMGDLLFVRCHPYLGDGNPEALLHALEVVSGLAPKLLVPGHGPVGTADSLVQMQHYVSTLDGLARKIAEEGKPEESIGAMVIPEPFEDWLIASFFSVNMHFLYQRWLHKLGTAVA